MSDRNVIALGLGGLIILGLGSYFLSGSVPAKKKDESKAAKEKDLPAEFRLAAEKAKTLNVKDTQTLLKLYGLYKRVVTAGEAVVGEKPLEPIARAKWTAWYDCNGLSEAEAAEEYALLVNSLDMDNTSTGPSKSQIYMGPKISRMQLESTDEVVEFEGSDMFDKVRENFSLLEEVLQANPGIIRLRDEENRTLLHWAVDGDDMDAVSFLVQSGAEIDPVDEDGFTPLGYAVSSNLSNLAKLLLDAGAQPSKASRDKSIVELTQDLSCVNC